MPHELRQPTVDEFIAYEDGSMSWEDQLKFFQRLIDNGMAWQLQGHYGRTAAALIQAGVIHQSGKGAE